MTRGDLNEICALPLAVSKRRHGGQERESGGQTQRADSRFNPRVISRALPQKDV